MGSLTLVWLLAAGFPVAQPAGPSLERFEFERSVMSIPVKLVLYAPDEANANGAADAAFRRLLQLNNILSDYDAESELLRLVATAGEGKAIPVSDELYRVLAHAQRLSEQSGGAFDVTINPVVRLWRKARRTKELPPPEKLREALQLVGYKNLRVDPKSKSVDLTRRGMRLDVGGIAKGFVCDEALALLRRRGITRAMIHAGGDIAIGDPPPGKAGWTIGVGVLELDAAPSQYLSLSRCGVATSGDMFQSVEIGGKRYSHIVDPKTGFGLTEHMTVTVVAPDGITADGLSTAVSVLGPERGMPLIEATPGAAALVLRLREGKVQTFQSSRWRDLPPAKPLPPELIHLWPLRKPVYIDRQGRTALEVPGDDATGFSDGLAGIRVGDKWGFIDARGETVIPPQFDRVGGFAEGRGKVERGGKWGYIDRTGKIVIEPQFTEAGTFRDGLALVNVGERFNFYHTPRQKEGFIDRDGKWVVPPKYDAANDFSEGLARVWGPQNGLIDRTGRLALDLGSFSSTGPRFSEGLIAAHPRNAGSMYLDRVGKRVIALKEGYGGEFAEGLATLAVPKEKAKPIYRKATNESMLYGYIDRTGNVVIEPQYAEAAEFHEGLARVRPVKSEGHYGKGDRWGYIDRTGKLVIPLEYNEAMDFEDGLAWVHRGGKLQMVSFHQPLQWEGGQWLLIDKSGKFLWSQPERSGGKWGAKTD